MFDELISGLLKFPVKHSFNIKTDPKAVVCSQELLALKMELNCDNWLKNNSKNFCTLIGNLNEELKIIFFYLILCNNSKRL